MKFLSKQVKVTYIFCAIMMTPHAHTSCSGIPLDGAMTFVTKVVMINASRLHMMKFSIDEDEILFQVYK